MTLTLADLGTITAIVSSIGGGCIWIVKLLIQARLAEELSTFRQAMDKRLHASEQQFMPRSELAAELRALRPNGGVHTMDALQQQVQQIHALQTRHDKEQDALFSAVKRLHEVVLTHLGEAAEES